MLTIPQLEALIKSVAGKKVKANIVRDIAFALNNHQFLFKHGETEIRLFIGMGAHETAGFTAFEEDGGKDAKAYFKKMYYDNEAKRKELGNITEKDASDFCGRGILHVTGRGNFQLYAKRIGKELKIMADPTLLTTNLQIATEISIAYWMERVQPSLAFLCNEEQELFVRATRGVNPGELLTKFKNKGKISEAKKAEQEKKLKKLAEMLGVRRKKVMAALHFQIPESLQSAEKPMINPNETLLMPSLNDNSYLEPIKLELSHEDWCAGVSASNSEVMKILIIRIKNSATRILGELYVDEEFVCYTIEQVAEKNAPFVSSGHYTGTWQTKSGRWLINLTPTNQSPVLKIYIGKPYAALGSIGVGYIGEDNLINSDLAIRKLREGFFRGNELKLNPDKIISVEIKNQF
jgi:predicted chitinase